MKEASHRDYLREGGGDCAASEPSGEGDLDLRAVITHGGSRLTAICRDERNRRPNEKNKKTKRAINKGWWIWRRKAAPTRKGETKLATALADAHLSHSFIYAIKLLVNTRKIPVPQLDDERSLNQWDRLRMRRRYGRVHLKRFLFSSLLFALGNLRVDHTFVSELCDDALIFVIERDHLKPNKSA
ncbi:hypothetical protein BHE74_00044156 [Ensete ventricosum]|nr:hypothetical protein GW17_00045282 [Ensete ventricosum]RWW49646.1 hypothetical protein BHE74_00044156 [Ensete ventricosum]